MARRSVVGICAVVVVGWVQAGCEDPAGVSPDATFALLDDRVVIAVGDQLTLDMEGMDQGRALDRRDVTWTSSDPTTVDVDDGVLRARAPGVVLVQGEAGRARDSVRVRVRLRDLEGGQVAARVQGSADAGADRFRGIASVNESLIGAFPTFSAIRQLSGELGDPETFQMELKVPGAPEAGETLLGAAEVIEVAGTSLIALTGAGGVVLYRPVEASPMRYEVWLGVDAPELEIEQVTAADGLEEGRIRGNVSFEAAGLLMETDGSVQHVVAPLADTTVRVYMEFDVPLRQALSGGGDFVATGPFGNGTGTLTGGVLGGGAGAWIRMGGLMPPVDGEEVPTWLANVTVWLPTLAEGEIDLPPSGGEIVGPVVPDGNEPWILADLRPVNVPLPAGPARTAVSRSGVVSVSRYAPPAGSAWGRLEAHYAVTLEVWDGTAFTGETLTLEGDLLLPIGLAEGPRATSPSYGAAGRILAAAGSRPSTPR